VERKNLLMKDNIPRGKHLMSLMIEQFISFLPKRVPHEDTRSGSSLELIPASLECGCIAETTKNPEMIIAWLLSK